MQVFEKKMDTFLALETILTETKVSASSLFPLSSLVITDLIRPLNADVTAIVPCDVICSTRQLPFLPISPTFFLWHHIPVQDYWVLMSQLLYYMTSFVQPQQLPV
ncbi:hypothetical protein MAR_028644 [Mya arenaria]|uniref:Uncharacterized protein n=1 Tax=Mya arenaria TaxID=6604 RepID=A0ABY7DE60_MYAAR|nr:hypothetical protein MAR_028644 [Mya arenaria]